MKRLLFSLFFGLAPLLSTASAGVISRDWKTPGDGLLTYDDVNQREWLDLPYLIDEFPVISRDPEKRLELVLPELEPGGSLEGFVVASSADVIELAISAGIYTSSSEFDVNELATLTFLDLIGRTRVGDGANGLLSEFDDATNGPSRIVANIAVAPSSQTVGLRFFPASESSNDIPTLTTSVMLYRNVPEPSGLTVVALAFSLIALAQRRLPKL